MRKRFLSILAILAFSGCASDSENNTIKAIGSFYGCSVSYSKGMSTSTSEESMNCVGLTLSGGELPGSLEAEEPASYSALTIPFIKAYRKKKEPTIRT